MTISEFWVHHFVLYTIKNVLTMLAEYVLVSFCIYFTVIEIKIDTPYQGRYIKASMIVMTITHSFNITRLSSKIYRQIRSGVDKKQRQTLWKCFLDLYGLICLVCYIFVQVSYFTFSSELR